MFAALSARLDGLRARYAEPHRAYHTQSHIDAMLEGLIALGPDVAHPPTLELATWYHDAIYDPAASDNEDRSAALLRAELDGLADPALLHRAELLILATATHVLPPTMPRGLRPDAALFLDLDMAILGAEPPAYAAYERAIASEYLPVHGPAKYHAGRAAFLRATLARPRLFLSDTFHHLDAKARRNLQSALGAS